VRKAAWLLLIYAVGVVLLSSVDVTYEWLSPLRNGKDGALVEWYSIGGLRQGLILLGNHEPILLANHEPAGPAGLSLSVHGPKLVPVPFYAGASPAGGGAVLAVWFIGIILWIVHSLWIWPRLELAHEAERY
jgi:hypothetical protein